MWLQILLLARRNAKEDLPCRVNARSAIGNALQCAGLAQGGTGLKCHFGYATPTLVGIAGIIITMKYMDNFF